MEIMYLQDKKGKYRPVIHIIDAGERLSGVFCSK